MASGRGMYPCWPSTQTIGPAFANAAAGATASGAGPAPISAIAAAAGSASAGGASAGVSTEEASAWEAAAAGTVEAEAGDAAGVATDADEFSRPASVDSDDTETGGSGVEPWALTGARGPTSCSPSHVPHTPPSQYKPCRFIESFRSFRARGASVPHTSKPRAIRKPPACGPPGVQRDRCDSDGLHPRLWRP